MSPVFWKETQNAERVNLDLGVLLEASTEHPDPRRTRRRQSRAQFKCTGSRDQMEEGRRIDGSGSGNGCRVESFSHCFGERAMLAPAPAYGAPYPGHGLASGWLVAFDMVLAAPAF